MELKKEIGMVGASVIVLNGLIGAGIFALPAEMMKQLGTLSPWIFPIFGVLMLSIVWCFAELASKIPETGGPVVYVNKAFGPLASFQTGWLFYLARATAIAANAHILTLYLGYLLPDSSLPKSVVVITVCALLTLINYVGIKRAIQFLDAMTLVKLLPIVALVAFALASFPLPEAQGQLPEFGTFGTAALLTLYAFIGFETVVVTSGETQKPKRTLPVALIITVILTALFYSLVQLAYISVMQGSEVEGAPLIAFAQELAGHPAAIAIALAAVFSIAANVLANMISTSRLSFAMAEEKEIPAWFGRVNDRFATPGNSILFLGALACALSLSGGFVWLAVVSVLSRMVIYLACIVSLLVLNRRHQWRQNGKGSRTIFTKPIPYIAIAVVLFAMSQSLWQAWLMLAGQATIGLILFYIWNYQKTKITQ